MKINFKLGFCLIAVPLFAHFVFCSRLSAQTESFEKIGKVIEVNRKNNAIILKCGSEKSRTKLEIKLSWQASNVCRIQAGADGHFFESMIEISKPWENVSPAIERKNGLIRIASKDISLQIAENPFSFTFYDSKGKKISHHTILFRANEKELSIQLISDIEPSESFYGLGEKFFGVNHSGKSSALWSKDAPGSLSDDTYAPVPFVLTNSGYGIFVNSTMKTNFDLGQSGKKIWSVTVPSNSFDCFFIYGPGLKKVIADYAHLAGSPTLPPLWAFKPWISKNSYISQQEVMEVTQKMQDSNIPTGAVVLEAWKSEEWHKFNSPSYPDPKKMIDALHSKGIKVILWVVPYWSPEQKTYAEAASKKYFAMKEDGTPYLKDAWFAGSAVVDFTNPEAVKWWKELHRPLVEMGVDGFKTDGGEGVMPGMKFHNGKYGDELHNIYPVLYNRTMLELLNEVKGKSGNVNGGILWGRSGFAGSQKYPALWAGDQGAEFKYIKAVICAGLSCGLSGIPFWGHDIGGYFGKPYKEEYLRWAAFGVFSPFMQFHGVEPHEPWVFGEESTQIYRDFCNLRMSLLPYIYSHAYNSTLTALPIIRALVLDYPDDERARTSEDTYLFGDEILVSPVIEEGGYSKTFYLPKGEWIDFWGPTRYAGGKEMTVPAPLSSIPVFIKNGSIIPRSQEGKLFDSVAQPKDKYILDIYPKGKSSFKLFDEQKVVPVTSNKEKNSLTISIEDSAPQRNYILRIWTVFPKEVRLNAVPMKSSQNEKDFKIIDAGWWYDHSTERLYVRVPASGKMEVKIKTAGIAEPVLFEAWSYPYQVVQSEGDISVDVSILNAPPVEQPDLAYSRKSGPSKKFSVKPSQVKADRFSFKIPNNKIGYQEDEIRFSVGFPGGVRSAVQTVHLEPVINLNIEIPGSDMTAEKIIFSERYKKLFLTARNQSSKDIEGKFRLEGVPESWEVRPGREQSFKLSAKNQGVPVTIPFYIVTSNEYSAGDFPVTVKMMANDKTLIDKSFILSRPLKWKIIGPFDNEGKTGFDKAYPPESEQDFGTSYDGKNGTAKWKDAENSSFEPNGFINFKKNVGDLSWVCAYAYTTVLSPEDQTLKVLAGSDDTLTLWLNGEEVISKNIYRGAKKDEDSADVKLKKGINKILIKVCQGDGDWGFFFRMTNMDGSPVNNLTTGGLK